MWHGYCSTHGVESGKHHFEAAVTDEGLCQVGWSTAQATQELGRYNVAITILSDCTHISVLSLHLSLSLSQVRTAMAMDLVGLLRNHMQVNLMTMER